MNRDHELREILQSVKTIAVVGLSSSQEKESYRIASYLRDQGYRVIPVNPTAPEIMGETSYPDLQSVPEKIDVVQVFRKSEDVPPIVDDAIQAGARVVWMQEGIAHEEAARKAQEAGLQVVMDACMRSSHRRLIGSRPLQL
jgi:predicted CoA-binding protein